MPDLVTTQSGSDIILYDQRTHALHTLNETVARVWENLDGSRTLRDLSVVTGLELETVKQALKQLEEAQLLEGALPEQARPTDSRRSFLKKAGLAAAVPAIVSVTAPMAASAQSGVVVSRATVECGTSNTCDGQDCIGNCTSTTCPPGWTLETGGTCLIFNDGVGGTYNACGITCVLVA